MLGFLASYYIHRTLTMGSKACCKALSVLDSFSPCNSGNFRHQVQVQHQLPSLTSQSISILWLPAWPRDLPDLMMELNFFFSHKFGFYFSKHCPQYTQCCNNSAPWNLCIQSFLFLKHPSYSQVYWLKLPTVVTGKIKRKGNSLLGVWIGNSGWTSLPPYTRLVTREELS